MSRIILILILSILSTSLFSQTMLKPGDIAFVAINSDGSDDQFVFLLLTDIQNSTVIHFTDNGWMLEGGFNAVYTESHFTWTATSDMLAGQLVLITTNNGNTLPTASHGMITGEMMTISVAGDQLLAYQGSKANPSFIAAISFNQNLTVKPGLNFDGESVSNASTALPVDLEMGVSAIHIYLSDDFSEQDNSRYNCLLTQGTREQLLSAINNRSNWVMDNDKPFVIDPFPCSFNVDVPTGISLNKDKSREISWVKANNGLVVSFYNDEECEVLLYDTKGTLIVHVGKQQGQSRLNLSTADWKSGLYILQVVYHNEKIVHKILL